MTVEQRVLTALSCEQPDRVPVFVYLNPYAEGEWYSDDPSYAEVLHAGEELAVVIHDWKVPYGFFHTGAHIEGDSRRLPNGDTEHMLQTPAGAIHSVTRGDWRGAGTIKRWVTEPDDVEKILSIPYVPLRPDPAPLLDARRRGADKWVFQVTLSDTICVAGLVDEMVMAAWTIDQRKLLRRFLDAAFERIFEQLEYCLENGIGPIYYFNGPEYALPPLMSPRDFQEFVVDYDSKLVELVHRYPGNYTIIHSHGRVSRFLEDFASIGTDGLNVLEPPPIGDTDLADAKKRIGDRVCLIGNIQYDDLVRGSEEEVEALVVGSIRQGGSGGGFILSPCASPYERPLPSQASRNFICYLKAGHRHGQY